VDEAAELYNKGSVNYPNYKALFSKKLLRLCLYKLVEFMSEYQIKELPPEDKVAKMIDVHIIVNILKNCRDLKCLVSIRT
jgi:hypothetical protein